MIARITLTLMLAVTLLSAGAEDSEGFTKEQRQEMQRLVESGQHDGNVVYRCFGVKGVYLGAPDWNPHPDGQTGAAVLLWYKGDGSESTVKWSNSEQTYSGLGVSMNGGFMIVLFGQQFHEAYVVNIGNLDLLHTRIRSGSSVFPNSAKAFHGVCEPAGNAVK